MLIFHVKMQRYARKTVSLGLQVAKYFCIGHCTFTYVGNLVICQGPSMEPTLYTNDILMTDCITPRLNKISSGDIVIAKLASKPRTLICKRIVGMPGDRLVYSRPYEATTTAETINLTRLREEEEISAHSLKDLTVKLKKSGMKETVVPPGHVWIEGDNHDNSGDSRHYGSIPQGLILSRVIARVWPPGDCRLFLDHHKDVNNKRGII